MPHRRSFGTVCRRRRTGRDAEGRRRGGYHPGWYVRYRSQGRRVTRYAGPTREAAEAYLEQLRSRNAHEQAPGQPRPSGISFASFAEQYLAYSRRDHSASTARP